MKAKRYVFVKAHLDWTTENWRKVLFFDESTAQQFTSGKKQVHWFSTGGPQHVSRVGHARLRTLKLGLHAE